MARTAASADRSEWHAGCNPRYPSRVNKVSTMYSSIFQSTTIPMLQEVVNFTQVRHTALTANIANIDTPGYKFRDLSVEDFQKQLCSAIESQRDGRPQSPGEPGFGQTAGIPHRVVLHDRSSVELEHQVTEMAKNQMQHNMAISIMQSQFRLLQAAITGQA